MYPLHPNNLDLMHLISASAALPWTKVTNVGVTTNARLIAINCFNYFYSHPKFMIYLLMVLLVLLSRSR